ncbi:MAG TPA: hypothetical protein PKB13_07660, partial [Clostridia bacterium]|nr:hypothetical protein [Clostridia bacterium]
MKSCKRILSSVMALMLVLSFGSFAMAADSDNGAVKVTTVSNTSAYTVESSVANVLLKIETNSASALYFEVTGVQLETSIGLIA